MQIVAVEAIARPLALRESQRMGAGTLSGSVTNVFVRVVDDQGTTGYGEAAPWAIFAAELPAHIVSVVNEVLAPHVVGRQFDGIAAARRTMDRLIVGNGYAKAAVETALWDLLGRRARLPVSQLLGGPVRDRLALSYSVAGPDTAQESRSVAELYEAGVRVFKVKVGVDAPEHDAARVSGLQERYPDVTIRLDFNETGVIAHVRTLLRSVDLARLDFVEQPFARGDASGLAWLRSHFDVPVCLDEGVASPAEVRAAGVDGTCELVSLKLAKFSGIGATREAAAVADSFGISCYSGAYSESRLGMAAAMSTMLTVPGLVPGCDYYFALVTLADSSITGGFEVREGWLYPSSAPGFGVMVPDEWFSPY